ncbi:hypothetical protein JCM10212_002297 [Sporobolomyces blumeae]
MAKRKAPQPAKVARPDSKAAPAPKRARFSNPPPPAAPAPPRPAAVSQVVKNGAKPAGPRAPKRFIVSAGSYERLLYGLEGRLVPVPSSPTTTTTTPALPYSIEVNPIFSFPAHLSSVRSVASSAVPSPLTGSERKVGGKYLVSGGADEVIKVWDLHRRKEVGSLEGDTTGTITCLRFVPERNMLLSASTDSTISLYRVRDWVLLRSLKGHKGRVNAVDAHPDGRVALSVGVDKNLRMWDLVAGKSVATLKLGVEGDVVRWNTNGTKFAVIMNSTLTVYGIDMSVHHTLTAPSRFHDVRFCHFPLDRLDPLHREYLFVACEDGKVRVFDVSEPVPVQAEQGDDDAATKAVVPENKLDPVAILVGHSNRVKMMDLFEVALPGSTPSASTSEPDESTVILTTVSSDGKIHLYDLAHVAPRRSTAHQDQDDAKGKRGSGKKGKGKVSTTTTTTTDSSGVEGPKQIGPSAVFDTDKTRLTCVSAIGLIEKRTKEQGANEEDEEGDGEGSSEEDEDEEDEEEDEEGEEGEMGGVMINFSDGDDDDEDEEDEAEEDEGDE